MRNNVTTGYITEKERDVIGRLTYEKTDTISLGQFNEYFSKYPKNTRSKLIYKLKKKGILKKIKNGLYIFSPLEAGPKGRNVSEYIIPGLLMNGKEYYVGYSSMYNYYNFTGQIFQVIYILNTKNQRERTVGGVRFKQLKVPMSRMYGITEIAVNGVKVRVSDRERTLVDLLYFSNPVGGLKRAYNIMIEKIRNKEINLVKFIKYLCLFPSAYVRKRAGYMLEEAAIKTGGLIKTIKPESLMKLYDNKTRKGRINRRWGVIINDTQG